MTKCITNWKTNHVYDITGYYILYFYCFDNQILCNYILYQLNITSDNHKINIKQIIIIILYTIFNDVMLSIDLYKNECMFG